MPRRSRAEIIIIDYLKTQPMNQASKQRIASALGWDLTVVTRVVELSRDDSAVAIQVGKGGVVQHRGSENVASNGLYTDIARIIEKYWGPKDANLRNIDVLHTAKAGTRGTGVWTHPDLVIAADPPRRDSASEPRRLHAVEVENDKGFDLRSVYQAHAQGRGADYSWVFGNTAPNIDKPDWDRLVWTADALGVGLVTFSKSDSYQTWTTHVAARRNDSPVALRADFLSVAVGPALAEEYELR